MGFFMPSVFIKTYGCQMNVRDSEQVARDLASRGYELVEREEGADVVLLNTCSVRDMAEQKAISKMETLGGRKNKRQHQIIGFLGCMAQKPRGIDFWTSFPMWTLSSARKKFHETGAGTLTTSFGNDRRFPASNRSASSMWRKRPARRIRSEIICSRRTR